MPVGRSEARSKCNRVRALDSRVAMQVESDTGATYLGASLTSTLILGGRFDCLQTLRDSRYIRTILAVPHGRDPEEKPDGRIVHMGNQPPGSSSDRCVEATSSLDRLTDIGAEHVCLPQLEIILEFPLPRSRTCATWRQLLDWSGNKPQMLPIFQPLDAAPVKRMMWIGFSSMSDPV
eukprot:5461435-Amphidinium_carterae.1